MRTESIDYAVTRPVINIHHGDCMEAMKAMPDKAYELAIVDPPYGIGRDGHYQASDHRKNYEFRGWDSCVPDSEYFTELFRVSVNQIIWGGNYFSQYLPTSMGWVFWYKGQQGLTMSDGELAFTSFDRRLEMVTIFRQSIGKLGGYIHPTQKPVRLYEWLLKNYAKPGDKILDTHGGSCSLAIACDIMGFDADIWEIDADYFQAATERFARHRQQEVLPL